MRFSHRSRLCPCRRLAYLSPCALINLLWENYVLQEFTQFDIILTTFCCMFWHFLFIKGSEEKTTESNDIFWLRVGPGNPFIVALVSWAVCPWCWVSGEWRFLAQCLRRSSSLIKMAMAPSPEKSWVRYKFSFKSYLFCFKATAFTVVGFLRCVWFVWTTVASALVAAGVIRIKDPTKGWPPKYHRNTTDSNYFSIMTSCN